MISLYTWYWDTKNSTENVLVNEDLCHTADTVEIVIINIFQESLVTKKLGTIQVKFEWSYVFYSQTMYIYWKTSIEGE